MNAQAYLEQAGRLNELIDSDLLALEQLRTLSTTAKGSIPGAAASGNRQQDKLGAAVAKIMDLETKINTEIDILIEVQTDVLETIQKIPDQTLQLLLRYRYLNRLKWEEIAERMHYSMPTIFRLHQKSLQMIADEIE